MILEKLVQFFRTGADAKTKEMKRMAQEDLVRQVHSVLRTTAEKNPDIGWFFSREYVGHPDDSKEERVYFDKEGRVLSQNVSRIVELSCCVPVPVAIIATETDCEGKVSLSLQKWNSSSRKYTPILTTTVALNDPERKLGITQHVLLGGTTYFSSDDFEAGLTKLEDCIKAYRAH